MNTIWTPDGRALNNSGTTVDDASGALHIPVDDP